MSEPPRPPTDQNQIIAALPPADYDRIAPHFKSVQLTQGQVLY